MENESLLHADGITLLGEDGGLGSDDAVFPRRLPVPGLRGPLRPEPVRVLPVLWREEKPLGIIRLDQRLICAANQIFKTNSASDGETGENQKEGTGEIPGFTLADVNLGNDIVAGLDPATDLAL